MANSNQWYFNKLVKIPCHKTPYRCPHRLHLSSQPSRSCAGPNIKVLKDKDLEFANSIGGILLANSNQWYFNSLVKAPCHKTPYRCPHRLHLSSQSSRSRAGSNIKVLKDKDLEFANSIRALSLYFPWDCPRPGSRHGCSGTKFAPFILVRVCV